MANSHFSSNLHFGLHFKSNFNGLYMGYQIRNPLRAQSKYGLMGSSAKIGIFFIGGSQEWFFRSKT